jgi:hypothetical protein
MDDRNIARLECREFWMKCQYLLGDCEERCRGTLSSRLICSRKLRVTNGHAQSNLATRKIYCIRIVGVGRNGITDSRGIRCEL